MWFGLSRTQLSPIGIDFGARWLKLLQVTATDPPQIVAAAAIELPASARQDPLSRQTFLTEQLHDLLRHGGFKGKRVICSLPAFQTLIQHLQISTSDQGDMDDQVALHLRQRLNVDPARMVVRHFQVGQVVADGAMRQEVICLAASREVVMRYVSLLRQLRCDVVGMHSETQAILTAFSHMFRREADSERTTCFIDIGAATTKMLVAHGKTMVLAKSIHAAGDALEAMVAEGGAADDRDAAQFAATLPPRRASVGLIADIDERDQTAGHGNGEDCGPMAMIQARMRAEGNAVATAGGGTMAAVTTAAVPSTEMVDSRPSALANNETLQCLVEELQMSVRHHQRLFPRRPIEKLVFLGGWSQKTSVCQHIARALRIGAQLGDPLARLTRGDGPMPRGVDLRKAQPGFAVSVGLCLSEPNL